ncbi:MAG: right-handed parallel beta-helix repeat-containing protein [Pseudomonadota bacterium]
MAYRGVNFKPITAYGIGSPHALGTGGDRPGWYSTLANTPAAMKAGAGTRDIAVRFVLECPRRADFDPAQGGGYVFDLGGTNMLALWNALSNEIQATVPGAGVSSEIVPAFNRRLECFLYAKPTTGQNFFGRDGRNAFTPYTSFNTFNIGPVASLGAWTGHFALLNRADKSGASCISVMTEFDFWYVPAGTHSFAQIQQMAWDFYTKGYSDLLPRQLTYVDGNWHMARFAPDETDLAAGTCRNRVIHPDIAQVLVRGSSGHVSGGAYFEYREGYEFSALAAVNQQRHGFVRIPTNPHFDVVDGTWGSIWEGWFNPDSVPTGGAAQSLMGDAANRLELAESTGLVVRFNAGGTTVTSPTTKRPQQDAWFHAAGVNTGAATNNLYAACHGFLGTVGTKGTDSLASGNFNLGSHNDSTASPNTAIFVGAGPFRRIIKIHKDDFPSLADLRRILLYHAESFDHKNPGALHPIIQELLAKRVNGAVRCKVLTYGPVGIREVTETDWRWDADAIQTDSPASAFEGTFVKVGSAGNEIAPMIIAKGAYTRRVIAVGDPAGTNPTVTKGVPFISGTACGPHAGATALASGKEQMTDDAKKAAVLRLGLYDYSVEAPFTFDVAGYNGKQTRLEGTLNPVYGQSTKMDKLIPNAADLHVRGLEITGSADDGVAPGAAAAHVTLERVVSHDNTGDGIGNAAGTDIVVRNCILKDNGAYGLDSAVDIVSENNIILGNPTGSINATAGSRSVHDNLDVAAVGVTPDASTRVGVPVKFKDVAAVNKDLGHMMQSSSIHSAEGGGDQGAFQYKYRTAIFRNKAYVRG